MSTDRSLTRSERPWGALVVALSLLTSAARAEPEPPIAVEPGWSLRTWTVEDGLPVNWLTDVTETPDGYIWVSTGAGLVRFDGVRFERLAGRDAGLWGSRLTRLAVAPDGRLFIATEAYQLSSRHHGEATLHPEPVYAFIEQPGALLVGSAGQALRAEGDRLVPVGPAVEGRVVAAAQEEAGRWWVGTAGHGLWRAGEGGRAERVAVPDGAEKILALAAGDGGAMWVGSARGLSVFRGARGRAVALPGCDGRVVSSLRRAVDGAIWAGGECGLFRVTAAGATRWGSGVDAARPLVARGVGGERLTFHDEGLRVDGAWAVRSSRITGYRLDRYGSVWVTTDVGVLGRARRAPIGRLGLGRVNTYGLWEDADGAVWVGASGHGLARWADGRVELGRVAAPVTTVARGPGGALWAAGEGLHRLGPDGVAARVAPAGLDAFSLLTDHAGTLWVGTVAGLARWRGRVERVVEPRLPEGAVRVMYEDPAGGLWVAVYGAGLCRLDPDRRAARCLGLDDGLPSTSIRALTPDGDGLWLGTEDRGLVRMTLGARPTFGVVGTVEGLPTDGVHQVIGDDRGRLWMNSNDGIFWVEAEAARAVADGRAAALLAIRYGVDDGMPHREGNGGAQGAGIRLRDGRILFPTQGGVAVIDPARIERDPRPPQVLIEGVEAGGRWRAPRGALTLGPSERDLAVRYTAVTPRHPEWLRFRYRLEGFDADWIDAATRREAFYTRVGPGTYRFVVQAQSADGVWSREGALAVVVTPRFHETGGFALGVVVLSIGLILGGVRLRLRRMHARATALEAVVAERTAEVSRQAEALRALDETKSRFFAHISHELRTPLSLIAGTVTALLDSDAATLTAEQREALSMTARNTRRLRRLTDQILALERGAAGVGAPRRVPVDLARLAEATVAAFRPVADRRRLTVEVEPDALACADPDLVETAVLNLVSNAVKFTAPDGRVAVRGGRRGARVWLAVEDDGRGIPADDLPHVFDRFYRVESPALHAGEGTGLGLALVRALIEQQGGAVRVTSAVGRGSRFEVELDASARGPDAPVYGALAEGEAALLVAPATVDDPADDPRTRVLVVDDNPDLRRFVGDVLRPRYAVLHAVDGEAGLAAARAHLPDLVLADVMMPGLDGFALSRALASDPETGSIPVLLLTARAEVEAEVAGLGAGAVDFLRKPFAVAVLRARVEAIIGRRARLREALRRELEAAGAAAPSSGLADARPETVEARARAVIGERIDDEELDVPALARALGMSRATLTRRLADEGAASPGALIRAVRLERAHALLSDGAGNVSEVAFAVGFASLAQFSRRFKATYGMPPSRVIPKG